MTSRVYTISVTLASAVADGGTISFALPAGVAAADLKASGFVLIISGHQTVMVESANTFTATRASPIVVTYGTGTLTGTAIPAGTRVTLQIETLAPAEAITALTDNSGGTASSTLAAISGTYSQSEVRNSIATLAAKVTALRAALILLEARVDALSNG